MPYTHQHINVICEQCYQEFSLSHHELRQRLSSQQFVCPHCHESVMLQETIGQKMMRSGLKILFTVNAVVILSVISSHLFCDAGLPPIIGLFCLLTNFLMGYVFKRNSVKLVPITTLTQ